MAILLHDVFQPLEPLTHPFYFLKLQTIKNLSIRNDPPFLNIRLAVIPPEPDPNRECYGLFPTISFG
jgi:hypothetical protein